MSKKKKNKSDKKTDKILDELAEDVGATDGNEETPEAVQTAPEEESEQTVADDRIPIHANAAADDDVVPVSAEVSAEASSESSIKGEFTAWPCDPEHRSATGVLLGEGSLGEVDISLDDEIAPRGGINLVLIAALFIFGTVGVWQFQRVASHEALEAKRVERMAIEQAHAAEQLAKQKKYGLLRIESRPAQAKVSRLKSTGRGPAQWVPMTVLNEATQQAVEVLTPVNMNNMDISEKMQFRLIKDGYEPTEFAVAEHLWVKDQATSEYKFLKNEELVPLACEFYFLYDMKKKREVKFETKDECDTHHRDAIYSKAAVTDCTCKEMPVDEWLEREKTRKAEAEKKNKKKGAKK